MLNKYHKDSFQIYKHNGKNLENTEEKKNNPNPKQKIVKIDFSQKIVNYRVFHK